MTTISVTTDEQLVRDRVATLLAERDSATTERARFLGAKFDLGLAQVGFPEGFGGLGVSPRLQAIVDDALRVAGAPSLGLRNPIGEGMAAPTILAHGTEEQRRRYLRPIFTGEEVWC